MVLLIVSDRDTTIKMAQKWLLQHILPALYFQIKKKPACHNQKHISEISLILCITSSTFRWFKGDIRTDRNFI